MTTKELLECEWSWDDQVAPPCGDNNETRWIVWAFTADNDGPHMVAECTTPEAAEAIVLAQRGNKGHAANFDQLAEIHDKDIVRLILKRDEYKAVAEQHAADSAALVRENQRLREAVNGLLAYRDRSGPINFQLEKADHFMNQMRAALDANEGEKAES